VLAELVDKNDPQSVRKIRRIAEKLVDCALNGEPWAIAQVADRIDGKPTQILEHGVPENGGIVKIVREFVHVTETREQIDREIDDSLLIEHKPINGNGYESEHVMSSNQEDDV
jgi:hypothetical protein